MVASAAIFAITFSPDLLLPLGGGLIVVAVLVAAIARRRRAAGQLTAHEQLERLRQEKGVRNDLESLMVEIEQLAKRLGAQLDAKTMHLERAIREADERIAQLREASGNGAIHPSAGAGRPEAAAPPPPVAQITPPPPRDAGDALTRNVCDLADQGLSPVDIARRLHEHVGKVELILALRKA